jgi:hypothetical protein
MSNRNITPVDYKLLWGKSGNRCAICEEVLSQKIVCDKEKIIGETAHICGLNIGSARHDDIDKLKKEEINSYKNFILLCPSCHKKVDNDSITYTYEKLQEIKEMHEKMVDTKLKSNLPLVTFAELEVITKYIISEPTYKLDVDEELKIIPPGKKIKKNHLSSDIGNLITKGMIGVQQVKEYLNKNPDPQFSERLRSRFVIEYNDLKKQNLNEDTLFYALLEFAYRGSSDSKEQAAGLTVLTYFFEICEVFEK